MIIVVKIGGAALETPPRCVSVLEPLQNWRRTDIAWLSSTAGERR